MARCKSIILRHALPKQPQTRLALVPTGMYCNVELQNARVGARLAFQVSWRVDYGVLVRKTMIKTDSTTFAILARQIYDKSVSRLLEQWRHEYLLEGIRIDLGEAMLIEFKTEDEESEVSE